MSAELFLLAPGRYRMEILEDGNLARPPAETVSVTGPRTTITFALPPQKLCLVRLAPAIP